MTPKKRRLAHEINVVPYIDVMLVLLVIFMITAPLLTQGVDVELPQEAGEALEYESDTEPLVLSVDMDGRYYLNRGEAPETPLADEEVIRIAASVIKHNPKLPVMVEGDRRVAYEHVMHAMTLMQQAGATSLGFATEPLTEAP